VRSDSVTDAVSSQERVRKKSSVGRRAGKAKSRVSGAGRGIKSGMKFEHPPRVGVRRSPRSHTQTVMTGNIGSAASSDEDEVSGPETVVNDDTLQHTLVSLVVVVLVVVVIVVVGEIDTTDRS